MPSPEWAPVSPYAIRTRRTAILLNVNAKRVAPGLVRKISKRLPSEDLFVTESLEAANGALDHILAQNYATLAVGGGDGTIASTLQRLARAQKASPTMYLPDLAILRLGTGNAIASWLRSGNALIDAERLLGGTVSATCQLRVLENPVTGEVFVFGSVGYDAQLLNDYVDVVRSTPRGWRRRLAKSLGGYVYALATRTLVAERKRGPTRVEVYTKGSASMIDPESDEEISIIHKDNLLFDGIARTVLMGTTPNYGFGMRVLPFARHREDRFHLRVSTASVPHILRNLRGIWRGTLKTPMFLDYLVEDVEVKLSQGLPLQLSGEAAGPVLGMRARLSPQTFRVLLVHPSGSTS
ncbi:MAG: hypothetical protein KTR25_01635 [Myxococcales bacterium]|nr:hypothetical protein [Myxococcales bacterium]